MDSLTGIFTIKQLYPYIQSCIRVYRPSAKDFCYHLHHDTQQGYRVTIEYWYTNTKGFLSNTTYRYHHHNLDTLITHIQLHLTRKCHEATR